ncbi:MAG: nucleotidyltransferase family protein [Planctomycetia bacterium]|nr:nucleotidyltransferase family protein [Planctomycetia bacterium]
MNHSSPEFIYLIQLLISVVRGETPPQNAEMSRSPLLFRLAQNHNVANILYDALIKLPDPPSEKILKRYANEKDRAIYMETMRQIELEKVFERFESERIEYLPLKGYVMRTLYPSVTMRTMSDVDILIKPTSLKAASAILLDEGYQLQKSWINEDTFTKNHISIDLHNEIWQKEQYYFPFFKGIWDHSNPQNENSFHYLMSWEYFYLFMTSHLTYHYICHGISIRYLLDVWVFIQKQGTTLNWDFVQQQLEEMKIRSFVDKIERLTDIWFEQKPGDELSDEMTDYILARGTPEMDNFIAANKLLINQNTFSGKERNRFHYILSRLFLPVSSFSDRYPILKKYPFLIVGFWITRWIRQISIAFCLKAIKGLWSVDKRTISKMRQFHKKTGLK